MLITLSAVGKWETNLRSGSIDAVEGRRDVTQLLQSVLPCWRIEVYWPPPRAIVMVPKPLERRLHMPAPQLAEAPPDVLALCLWFLKT